MVRASFRFDGELETFLRPRRRRGEFDYDCAEGASIKQAIEALGVPHTEVGQVLVDGEPAGFGRRVGAGERIAVYAVGSSPEPDGCLRSPPPDPPRFVADVHLGGLARLLRLAGFDTVCDERLDDPGIAALAVADRRIVLTRDRDLLKRRGIEHGAYLRALRPEAQLREVFGRFDLARRTRPFALCLECNVALRPAHKAEVLDRLPPAVAAGHERFVACPACRRIFWEGSHWRSMRALLESLPAPGGDSDGDA